MGAHRRGQGVLRQTNPFEGQGWRLVAEVEMAETSRRTSGTGTGLEPRKKKDPRVLRVKSKTTVSKKKVHLGTGNLSFTNKREGPYGSLHPKGKLQVDRQFE